MKKILLLLLLPALSWGLQFHRNTNASSYVQNATIWAEGVAPSSSADTVIYDQSVCGTRIDTVKTATLTIGQLQFLNTYLGWINLAAELRIVGVTSKQLIVGGAGQSYFNGASRLNFRGGASSIICTVAVKADMTGPLDFSSSGAFTNIKFMIGHIDAPSASQIGMYPSQASSTFRYVFYGDSVIGNVFRPGVNGATTIDSIWYGATIFKFATVDMTTYQTGTSHSLFQTSKWYVSGNITRSSGAGMTSDMGTSLFTLNGTGAQTITSNARVFYDLTVDNTGSSFVTRADSLTCHDLTLTDGPWNSATYGIRCDDLIHASTDSVRYQNVWLTGDYTRAAGATKSDTAAQHLRFLAGTSHTAALAGKTYGQITMSGPTALNGGAVIRVLSCGVDGVKCTSEAGKLLTVTTLSMGGAVGSLDTLRSGTPGTRCTLALAGTQTVTVQYAAIGDVHLTDDDTIVVSDGTSVNLGNNSGNIVFPAGSTTTRRNRGWLGLGLWIRP
jgi:hypothetical protein